MPMQFGVCQTKAAYGVAVYAAKIKQEFKGLTYPFWCCRNNLAFNVLVLKLFTPLFPYYFGAM